MSLRDSIQRRADFIRQQFEREREGTLPYADLSTGVWVGPSGAVWGKLQPNTFQDNYLLSYAFRSSTRFPCSE
jgi:hypothetical protein